MIRKIKNLSDLEDIFTLYFLSDLLIGKLELKLSLIGKSNKKVKEIKSMYNKIGKLRSEFDNTYAEHCTREVIDELRKSNVKSYGIDKEVIEKEFNKILENDI